MKAKEESVFDFTTIPKIDEKAPPIEQFQARDGANISYRFYDSPNKDRVMILIHGSSGHGDYWHPLAEYLSVKKDIGQVYVPNLRGHFGSGTVRGDCSYIGQLEDDLYDMLQHFHLIRKKIYLVGHSSGGGFAIRFAGSKYGDMVTGFILLAPAIPGSPVLKQGTSGGWARLSHAKSFFLSILNFLGIHSLNHMQVVEFNKPKKFCDGRETLGYSYNLAKSYHPRRRYQQDIKSLKNRFILFVGSLDEGMIAQEYQTIMPSTPENIKIIEGAKHMDIVWNPEVMASIGNWIANH